MDTKHIQTVWRIMEALRDASQLEDSLASSLDILREASGSAKGSIWMLDDTSGRIVALIASGTGDAIGESAAFGEGLVGEVCESGTSRAYRSSEVNNVRFAGADGPAITGRSLLCVPVRTPKHTIGCLLLSGKESGEKDEGYTPDDIELCESCCSILALDIEDKGLEFRPFEDRKPIIFMRGIVREFMSGEELRRILNGVDLDVFPGEMMVILGESGCGKSTLLNIIGGMDTMTEGSLVVEGKDMSRPAENELTEYRRKYIGFIFQAYNLMPNLSALENIEFIGEISDDPMDSEEALRMVGLRDKSASMPSALSGGQMQRVSIARALVKNPRIILADEPTAALDHETSIKVLEVIENIVRLRSTTVLMVTHNPEIAKMANRVVRLRNGRISSVRVNLHPLHAKDLVW